jgi:ribonuclease Z
MRSILNNQARLASRPQGIPQVGSRRPAEAPAAAPISSQPVARKIPMNRSIPLRSRAVLKAAVAAVIALGAAAAAHAEAINVTVLGSGSPVPSARRFSQATLVEAGGQKLLFDAGRGVTIRLAQLNIPFRDITATFITHLHSDHLVGLPDLWLTGWLPTPWASRTEPFRLIGPKGTQAMARNLTAAFDADIQIRIADERLPPKGIEIEATDIGPGVVWDRGGVKVTAFETDHGEKIKPNHGFIIEHDGKKVVISSDTMYDERVARAAAGADLLLHEVAHIDPGLMKQYPRMKEVADHHTLPEDAGRIFAAAKPKLAAYTHVIVAKPNQGLDIEPTEIIARTRGNYTGPLVVADDLMRFKVDGGRVTVTNARGESVTPDGS